MSARREEEQVAEQARRLEREADEMEARVNELGGEIDSTRQDFQHKRNDPEVTGLPPDPEAEREEE